MVDKWIAKKQKIDSQEQVTSESIIVIDDEEYEASIVLPTPNDKDCENLDLENLPSYLSKEQWDAKLKTYKWLVIGKNGLGCLTCRSVGGLGPSKTQGLKLASEWVEGCVQEYGSTKEKKQQSIRKKISCHRLSSAHIKACEIVSLSKKDTFQNLNANAHTHLYETTCRVFRTAYQIAKNNRPLTDLQSLIELQKANDVKMGRILHSNHSCTNICNHISEVMRQKLVRYIIDNDEKIGFMIDESTTISKHTALVICIRFKVPNSIETTSMFFDILQLESTTAVSILETLLGILYKHGFTENFLMRNWLSFACDGASNMLGRNAGVAKLLTDKFPDIIVWHCSNHRLELAVHDVVTQMTSICHMKIFFDKLYAVYSASPKNKTEIENIAHQLSIKLNAVGRILGTRWVSSSARSMRAVWNNYEALYQHFHQASQDAKRSGNEKAQYMGLKKKLRETNFVLNLGLMLDALIELEHLSLKLQERTVTLEEAHRLISLKFHVFQSMAHNNSGEYYAESENAVKNMTFKGISLENGKMPVINKKDFFLKLSENVSKRMLTTRASHTSANVGTDSDKMRYTQLIDNMKIFDSSSWPKETVNPCFGDKKICILAKTFKVCSQNAVQGFREYVASGGHVVPLDLQPLKSAVNTLIISTAECERSFSTMNIIVSPIRNSLLLKTASNLMFISLVGPPLQHFDPKIYVHEWLKKGYRHADYLSCRPPVPKDLQNELWSIF